MTEPGKSVRLFTTSLLFVYLNQARFSYYYVKTVYEIQLQIILVKNKPKIKNTQKVTILFD